MAPVRVIIDYVYVNPVYAGSCSKCTLAEEKAQELRALVESKLPPSEKSS